MAEQYFLTKMILMYAGAGIALILLIYTGVIELVKTIRAKRRRKKLKLK